MRKAVVVAVLAAYIGYVAITDLYMENTFGAERGESWIDFSSRLGGSLSRERMVDTPKGMRRIAISVQQPLWTQPSGPAVYVFNEHDKLVDFTLDVGDEKGILFREPATVEVLNQTEALDEN